LGGERGGRENGRVKKYRWMKGEGDKEKGRAALGEEGRERVK